MTSDDLVKRLEDITETYDSWVKLTFGLAERHDDLASELIKTNTNNAKAKDDLVKTFLKKNEHLTKGSGKLLRIIIETGNKNQVLTNDVHKMQSDLAKANDELARQNVFVADLTRTNAELEESVFTLRYKLHVAQGGTKDTMLQMLDEFEARLYVNGSAFGPAREKRGGRHGWFDLG